MTEIKTSTLNFKVQLFSIVLLSAIVLSLAWVPIKEDVKTMEKEEEVAAEIKVNKQAAVISAGLKLTNKSTVNVVLHQPIDPIDTLKKQFKILIEDEKGKQVIYNSLDEMPKDLRLEFLDKNRKRFAMPVFHFGNGVKGFNGFTMQAAGDSTLINKINVNGKTIYSTKGFHSGDSTWLNGYSYSFGDSGITFRDTSKAFRKGDKASAFTFHGMGKSFGSAKGIGSQNHGTSFSRITPVTNGLSSGRSMTIGSTSEGTPEERAAMVKKILETKENRDRIAKGLLRPGYRMNLSGQLEEDVNSVFVFDDVALRAADILKVIRPGLKNEYGIYIPTRDEKLQKLVENPANKEQLRQMLNSPESKYKGFSMNGRAIYQFEEALVQKSDILEYLQRNQKAKQSLMKD